MLAQQRHQEMVPIGHRLAARRRQGYQQAARPQFDLSGRLPAHRRDCLPQVALAVYQQPGCLSDSSLVP
jgi:hypothetical protein